MRQKLPSVTTLQQSPHEERRARFIKYTVAMVIRVVCIVLMLFVQGWWLLLCAAGAVLLPYFAVIVANAVRIGDAGDVVRPGPLSLPPLRSSDSVQTDFRSATPDDASRQPL
jgi:hypothetical protein